MCKAALRKEFLEKRSRISEVEARECSERIASLLCAEKFWREASSVFCFIGVNGEPDTSLVIHRAFAEGKAVCVPRITKGVHMETVPVTSPEAYGRAMTEWLRSYGIPEPPASFPAAAPCVDLVIVPSLAVDRQGFRLGYGGGCYDRFITKSRSSEKPPLFAAIQFDAFLLRNPLPCEEHDMRVDAIVTEKEVILLSKEILLPSPCDNRY
jgi:5-formyltetrahydrofolate cyclo-ligase